MSDQYDLQDVARCNLCETPTPCSYCRFCEKNLCNNCQKKHVLDDSKKHKVVPFERRKSLTYCKRHSSNLNDHYCEPCHNPICELCVSSKEHEGHNVVDILVKFKNQEVAINDDIQELHRLDKEYKRSTFIISHLKDKLNKNSEEMIKSIREHGEDWHREINTIVNNLQVELEFKVSSQQSFLDDKEDAVKSTRTQIKQRVVVLKKILDTKDDKSVLAYESADYEFKKCPPEVKVPFPRFCKQKIGGQQLNKHFGYLKEINATMKEKERNTTEDVNHYDNPEYQFLIDDPQIKTSIDINTQFKDLCSISCLSDENVWVSECNESTIKLVNFQGELVKSIPTKTRNMPWDIAVTKSGDLVYTDYADHTLNIVKGKHRCTRINPTAAMETFKCLFSIFRRPFVNYGQ